MVDRKAQAGMDFLATYGWALILLAVVIASLFSLGIFDLNFFAGRQATGFTNLVPVDWNLKNGVFQIVLKNDSGVAVSVSSIAVDVDGTVKTYAVPFAIPEGSASGIISVSGFPANSRGSYSAKVNINFTDSEAGFSYVESGRVTGEYS